MSKYITLGSWNSNYKYIFITYIFLVLYGILNGTGYDSNPDYYINILPSGQFSAHYLIHQIYLYFICIIFSVIIILFETFLEYKRKKEKKIKFSINKTKSI